MVLFNEPITQAELLMPQQMCVWMQMWGCSSCGWDGMGMGMLLKCIGLGWRWKNVCEDGAGRGLVFTAMLLFGNCVIMTRSVCVF